MRGRSLTRKSCKKDPHQWRMDRVARSPFKTLKRAKEAEKSLRSGKAIGFTATSSLKSQGRIKRANGCYVLGAKYF